MHKTYLKEGNIKLFSNSFLIQHRDYKIVVPSKTKSSLNVGKEIIFGLLLRHSLLL